MKTILFYFISVLTLSLQAQAVTKSNFDDTEWFSNSVTVPFFKSDTISIVRVKELGNKKVKVAEIYKDYFEGDPENFTTIYFDKSGKLRIELMTGDDTTKLNGKWNIQQKDGLSFLDLILDEKTYTYRRIADMDADITFGPNEEGESMPITFTEITFKQTE